MSSPYKAYHFTVNPKKPATEILLAELAELDFESFIETEEGLTAYIQQEKDRDDLLATVFILNNDEFEISYTVEAIAPTNWNREWERNFEPLEVDNTVSIRAPFHPNPGLPYDIVIEPKMSFGTGHHETTFMMVQNLNELELTGKEVLDMGCGTGILAIFSEMKGAKPVTAIDIDPWCYENSLENCGRNKCEHIQVLQGDSSLLKGRRFDLIIANINRNILLADIQIYAQCLNAKGHLLLSGFYQEDIPIIDQKASANQLKLQHTLERNNWVSLRYLKK